MSYFVYILQCSDNSLYIGIAKDIEKRVKEHNTSSKGAKYTRSRRPVVVIYTEEFDSRSSALKREWVLKQLSRHEKEILLRKYIDQV